MGNRLVTRACGPCGARVLSAVFVPTGRRCEIERIPESASLAIRLAILPELPFVTDGKAPPQVTPSRRGGWREHVCPKARRAFSAANFNRKRREP